MDTITSHESTTPSRLRGGLRRPRLWGSVLLGISGGLLALLLDRLRNMAPPGKYGQMTLSYPVVNVVFVLVAGLVLLGIVTIALCMLVLRRPANKVALLTVGASVLALLAGAVFASSGVVSSFGEGCIERYSASEIRELWADLPTVGEQLTGGLLQGNVVDDLLLRHRIDMDPDAAGCPGL